MIYVWRIRVFQMHFQGAQTVKQNGLKQQWTETNYHPETNINLHLKIGGDF